ncbi:MAG: hypothetical protein ACMUHM_09180 [Thermoplasmatota archaeon]
MEAIWKRILLLLLVGVLLTLLVFPIVRGEPVGTGTNTSSDEKIPTMLKEVYFGPVDRTAPQDGRPDLYEWGEGEFVFTYQLLAMNDNGSYEVPVAYAPVYLVLEMWPYENYTKKITDIRGRVHFNFTKRLTDTYWGDTFQVEDGRSRSNLTLTVDFSGNEIYLGSKRTKYCDYHVYPSMDYKTSEEKMIELLKEEMGILIFISLVIGLVLLFCLLFLIMTAKEYQFWIWKNEREQEMDLPRFNIVRSPSGSCPEGPSSPRP